MTPLNPLLIQFPSARAAISLSNLEVLSILLSPAWQNQYLALGILYAGLLLEAAQLSSVNIQRSSSSSKIPTSTSLMKSSSSKSYKKGNDHSSSSKISGKEGSGKRIPQKVILTPFSWFHVTKGKHIVEIENKS